MTDRPHREAGMRIVDAVFGRDVAFSPWRQAVGAFLAIGAHGLALLLAILHMSRERDRPPPPPERIVELAAPPPAPPPPPPKLSPPPPAKAPPQARPAGPPPPPAQAARIVAREPDPREPVDLGDSGFVTGNAKTYAGGYTSPSGTNPKPVDVPPVAKPPPPAREPDRPDLSRPVGLTDDDWSCPWPGEADDKEIDEQQVLIKVLVRADGSVDSAQSLRDPGFGFGQAAVACALRTRFQPALDKTGKPMSSLSPPIRVRFTR